MACWNCNKYLTVGPIMVSTNRKMICGRCHHLCDGTYKTSLYNVVAESLNFKCVNNYEGCKARLSLKDTKEHEENCIGKMYECHICSYEGILSQLYEHTKRSHLGMVIEDNVVKVPLQYGYQKAYVHSASDLFQIFEISVDDDYAIVSILVLREKPVEVSYDVTMFRFDVESNLECVLEKFGKHMKNLTTYRIKLNDVKTYYSDREWIYCKIQLNDKNYFGNQTIYAVPENRNGSKELALLDETKFNLHKYSTIFSKIYGLLRDAHCSRCNQSTKQSDSIYYCEKFHLICEDCSKRFVNCLLCNDDFPKWKEITVFDYLPCCYSNCGYSYGLSDLAGHRRECEMRTYKCPLLHCYWTGLLNDLKSHWHSEETKIFDINDVVFQANVGINITSYFVYQQELFKVTVIWICENIFFVNFDAVDVVFLESYEFKFKHPTLQFDFIELDEDTTIPFKIGEDFTLEVTEKNST